MAYRLRPCGLSFFWGEKGELQLLSFSLEEGCAVLVIFVVVVCLPSKHLPFSSDLVHLPCCVVVACSLSWRVDRNSALEAEWEI